jgi:hypothetical protein
VLVTLCDPKTGRTLPDLSVEGEPQSNKGRNTTDTKEVLWFCNGRPNFPLNQFILSYLIISCGTHLTFT